MLDRFAGTTMYVLTCTGECREVRELTFLRLEGSVATMSADGALVFLPVSDIYISRAAAEAACAETTSTTTDTLPDVDTLAEAVQELNTPPEPPVEPGE